MQLLEKKGLNYELRPENLEDLWILSQFIAPDDKLYATTERKVKVGSENNPKQVKKLIFVELLVGKTSFESDILRVSGEIKNETEFTSVGSSHTLSFQVNDKLSVQKNQVLKYEEKLLKNSLDSKKSLSVIFLLDKDELICAEFGDFSYRVLFEKKGLGSKKYTGEEINENEEKLKIIEPFLDKDYSNILFCGPGNFKESLKKYIEDKKGIKSTSFSWQEVSSNAIQKLIKEINKKGIVKDNQLGLENEKVSQLLVQVQKQEKAAYGFDEVKGAVDSGRAELLLISTKIIDKFRDEDRYQELNSMMKTVEDTQGELVIVQSKHEPGKILDGLGGIASVLRY